MPPLRLRCRSRATRRRSRRSATCVRAPWRTGEALLRARARGDPDRSRARATPRRDDHEPSPDRRAREDPPPRGRGHCARSPRSDEIRAPAAPLRPAAFGLCRRHAGRRGRPARRAPSCRGTSCSPMDLEASRQEGSCRMGVARTRSSHAICAPTAAPSLGASSSARRTRGTWYGSSNWSMFTSLNGMPSVRAQS